MRGCPRLPPIHTPRGSVQENPSVGNFACPCVLTAMYANRPRKGKPTMATAALHDDPPDVLQSVSQHASISARPTLASAIIPPPGLFPLSLRMDDELDERASRPRGRVSRSKSPRRRQKPYQMPTRSPSRSRSPRHRSMSPQQQAADGLPGSPRLRKPLSVSRITPIPYQSLVPNNSIP